MKMGFPSADPESHSPKKSPLADEDVVARVLSGDTALYEVIVRRYNQRLFRIAVQFFSTTMKPKM